MKQRIKDWLFGAACVGLLLGLQTVLADPHDELDVEQEIAEEHRAATQKELALAKAEGFNAGLIEAEDRGAQCLHGWTVNPRKKVHQ
jgi:hypothetical protein